MIDYKKNNLVRSTSPYLKQHQYNPSWWQEWSKETLDHARENNKIIFASVGYATCHWCHMMAKDVFSNKETAEYLNAYFVSIKIDREQRPDIDAYLMSYITSLSGSGGWPLNAFLTPDLKPIYAVTYLPVESNPNMTGFWELLKKIRSYYDEKKNDIGSFSIPHYKEEQKKEEDIINDFYLSFDLKQGGFGLQHKFPSFCSLLFLLYYYEVKQSAEVKSMLETTLDRIMLGGLHDHLQGGFFRYCVDRAWTIPHFEKMLYDQALGLWAYSLAYQIFKKDSYRIIAEKIIQCLEESFENNGVYVSAHDADTEHKEGLTYLWTIDELKNILTANEYAQFRDVYYISQQGNFEGKNHLIRHKDSFLPSIENKLLEQRKQRPQPFIDQKILTNWNCLVGIAFVHAFRYLPEGKRYLDKSNEIMYHLLTRHKSEDKIFHSSCNGTLQNEALFLEDYGSLLLFMTFLFEETGQYPDEMLEISKDLNRFRSNGHWAGSINNDFLQVQASEFDNPAPSATALVQLALTRKDILDNGSSNKTNFKKPLINDFYNIAVLIGNGLFHIRETTQRSEWQKLSVNTFQKTGRIQGLMQK